MIQDLLDRMEGRGRRAFYGEAVSITDHMLQTAHAAERDGAAPVLVAAALLHDVAYVIHEPADDRMSELVGRDLRGVHRAGRHLGHELREDARAEMGLRLSDGAGHHRGGRRLSVLALPEGRLGVK